MKKILLVDDAALMREMLRYILSEEKDLKIYEAVNGIDAVSKYVEVKPDIVFMDIVMPGQNGIKALQEIKKYDPNAKVIICSQVRKQEIIVESIKAGAVNFILKPFVAEKVLQVVRSVLG